MTTDNAAEMTPGQLRDELAQAQQVARSSDWLLNNAMNVLRQEREATKTQSAKLADACAMRDALADEANELEEARDYNASLVQAERRLRQEAEQHYKAALKIMHNRAERLEKAEQRAEHAEALAQLVTPELADLLERMGSWNAARLTVSADRPDARALAARIREALGQEGDDES